MRIKGVSKQFTKRKNEVAFDVEGEIDSSLMRKVPEINGVNFFEREGRLVFKSELEPLPVKANHVEEFLRHYNHAEREQQILKQNNENQRIWELQEICNNVGYHLTDDGEETANSPST